MSHTLLQAEETFTVKEYTRTHTHIHTHTYRFTHTHTHTHTRSKSLITVSILFGEFQLQDFVIYLVQFV